MLEKTYCNICGSNKSEVIFQVKDLWFNIPGEFSLVRCQKCGLVYLNPRPQERDVSKYYPDNYPPFSQENNVQWLESIWEKFLSLFNADLSFFPSSKKGNVLDVGCGSGKYLAKMKQRGWSVFGVDTSEVAAAEAKKKGIDIFIGNLKDAEYPDSFFDAIVMLHVLEHIYNPSDLLKEIHRILRDNGKFVLEVPNYNSLEAKLFRDKWSAIDAPRHLYLFTPTTLIKLLRQNGFEVGQVGYNPTPVSLAMSLNYFWGNKHLKLFNKNIGKYYAYLYLPFTVTTAMIRKGASVIICVHKNIW